MCDDDIDPGFEDPTVSRRTFGILAAAAAGVATTARAAVPVMEMDVTVKTPDGMADCALIHPESGRGPWPAVIMWPDIMTLRPVFREMGKRLAGEGFVVLIPNFYYRTTKAPITLNFSNPEDRPKFAALRAPLDDAAMDRDATAYVAYLDSQSMVDKRKKIGVQGYCMGGPFSFRTAAIAPTRIGAVATFHGGGLATTQPNSPHLLVAKTKADYLICVAQNDDKSDPTAKDKLAAAFNEAKLRNKVEVYPADHGWTVRGSAVYNEPAAEKAWAEMVAQYKRALA